MVRRKLPICLRWVIEQKKENSSTLVVEMKVVQTSVQANVRYSRRVQQAMLALVAKPSSILKLDHFLIGKRLLQTHKTQLSVVPHFG